MSSEISMRVVEDEPVRMTYVEAKLKPEQSKTVTPTDEGLTVLPDEGSVLSSVVVNPIPEATEDIDITTNGDHDVRKKRTAHVQVLPVLQNKTVTPGEQAQQVGYDSQYDGLSEVLVEQIPAQYIIPSGTKEIAENGTGIDVREFAAVNVAVPVPTMPEEYAIGGTITDRSETGYFVKRGIKKIGSSTFTNHRELITVDIPDSVETIETQAFAQCVKLAITELPSALKEIASNAFFNCPGLTSIKFRSTLDSIASNSFNSCTNLLNIYVPWAEGEVANAPWGASKATIIYNYTGD